jgi:phosphoribosylformylglycinamidine cyclo-ligase
VKTALNLVRDFSIGGIAHITGGGITETLPRVIPKGCRATIHRGTWDVPLVFPFLQERGKISEEEMFRTFNNGIGMILIVKPKDLEDILGRLRSLGEKAFVMGEIERANKDQPRVVFS